MKNKTIVVMAILVIALLIFIVPAGWLFLSFSNSINCDQLVTDTYEIHSGINIPKVIEQNCHYDEEINVRITIYYLEESIDLKKFKKTDISDTKLFLEGLELLEESKKPDKNSMLLATGERYGRKWTYLYDNESGRLWAELKY